MKKKDRRIKPKITLATAVDNKRKKGNLASKRNKRKDSEIYNAHCHNYALCIWTMQPDLRYSLKGF